MVSISLRRGGLLSQVFLTLSRQISTAILQLCLMVIIARHLGPEGNGYFAVGVLICMTLAGFTNLGLPVANAYFVGKGAVNPLTALVTAWRFGAVLTIVTWVSSGILLATFHHSWFPSVPTSIIAMGIGLFPIMLMTSLTLSILQGSQDFRAYNFAMVVPALLSLIGAGLILWTDTHAPEVLLLVWGSAQAVGLTVATYFVRRRPSSSVINLTGYATQGLHYGWKPYVANFLSFLVYRTDIFLVNLLLGAYAAGIYVVAIQLIERFWMLSQAVATVLFPRLASMENQEDQRSRLTPLVARWVGMGSLLAALIIALVAMDVVRLFFGSSFELSGVILLYLLPGAVLFNIGRVIASDIAARGHPELTMYVAAATLVFTVTANLMLIPRFGVTGAAVAMSSAYAFAASLNLAMYVRMNGSGSLRKFVPKAEDVVIAGAVFNALRGRTNNAK